MRTFVEGIQILQADEQEEEWDCAIQGVAALQTRHTATELGRHLQIKHVAGIRLPFRIVFHWQVQERREEGGDTRIFCSNEELPAAVIAPSLLSLLAGFLGAIFSFFVERKRKRKRKRKMQGGLGAILKDGTQVHSYACLFLLLFVVFLLWCTRMRYTHRIDQPVDFAAA